jgi:hypothetical protein
MKWVGHGTLKCIYDFSKKNLREQKLGNLKSDGRIILK